MHAFKLLKHRHYDSIATTRTALDAGVTLLDMGDYS
jgi:hypothetical protein